MPKRPPKTIKGFHDMSSQASPKCNISKHNKNCHAKEITEAKATTNTHKSENMLEHLWPYKALKGLIRPLRTL